MKKYRVDNGDENCFCNARRRRTCIGQRIYETCQGEMGYEVSRK